MKALWVAVAVVTGAALVVAVRLSLDEPAAQDAAPAPQAAVAEPRAEPVAVAVEQEQPHTEQEMALEPEPEQALVLEEPEDTWQPDPAAVESLRQSMEQGDPRAPPIARRETEREMPTEEELGDPALYLQYETRQQQQVYASFIQASEKKISDLQKLIDRAKAEGGVSPEQLAEGEEKLRRLQEMREQLMQQYPDLAEPEGDAEDADEAP